MMMGYLLLLLVIFGFAFWVDYDARCRGMEHHLAWGIATFFQPVVVGILYFVVKKPGNLVKCVNCGKLMLATLDSCPHCGIRRGGVEGETL